MRSFRRPPTMYHGGVYSPPHQPSTYPDQRDATMEFHDALSDPSRWTIKLGVPIFKSHQRVDPNTKQLIKVDPVKLQRIATNLQRMERAGRPIRMTLGHTEPGKPETEQPPVCGYYRNARVAPFGPNQEPAVVVDEWLDPAYLPNRKNYPFRSAEYYDDSEDISGVALLTRDPWLELGVVAYKKASPGCTFYSRASEISQPRHYHFLTGDEPMWPENNPQYPAGVPAPQPEPTFDAHGQFVGYHQPAPAVPVAAPGAAYYNRPQSPAPRPAPQPVPYAYPQPQPYGSAVGWNANYRRPSMQRSHPSNFAYDRYGRYDQYANEPPSLEGDEGGGMPPGPGGGGGEEDVLATVHDLLSQAVAALAEHLGGGGGQAPESPFPPTEHARYGRGGPAPRPNPHTPRRYAREPQRQPQRMARTISGLPVGYQLELDRRDAEVRHLNDAMRVLYYERDESDTRECVAEIRGLIAQGFNVGDYELAELKAKDDEGRAAYLQHIVTKYERTPTDYPPPMPGDPTPGPAPESDNRPATREEVDAALEMSKGDRRPGAYVNALNYIRTNGGVNRVTQYDGFNQPPPSQFADPSGDDAPNGDYPEYPEPSANGHGY